MTTPDVVSQHIRQFISYGQRVYDRDGSKLGTVGLHDDRTGWLTVKNPFIPRDVYVPMALVDAVDVITRDVHLAVTKDHLKRVYVKIGKDGIALATIVAPDN